mgnify:CR=1 FL=1
MTEEDKRPLLLIVCGGRDFDEAEKMSDAIKRMRPFVIAHGGARGADTLAREFATAQRIPQLRVDAPWDVGGRSSGQRRNRLLLNTALDYAAEFRMRVEMLAAPGGAGTAGMVRFAMAAKVPVLQPWATQ